MLLSEPICTNPVHHLVETCLPRFGGEYRNYESSTRQSVVEKTYGEMHQKQTVEFVKSASASSAQAGDSTNHHGDRLLARPLQSDQQHGCVN